MKKFYKTTLASAVLLATTGLALTAQADSLLAPLIIDTSGAASLPYSAGNVRTFLNIKVKGSQGLSDAGNPQDHLHYTWIRKGNSVIDLFNPTSPCRMVNNEGRVTANDMVFQQTRGPASRSGLVVNNVTPDGTPMPASERSRPNTHGNNDFVGMLVVTDLSNESKVGSDAPEGDMSGFAYIVQAGPTGDVVEYKLLNNHHSAEDGDFDAGFGSKKVVDFAWMRNGNVRTGWTVMVTGPDMSKHAGAFNSSYDATVLLSQKIHADGTQDDPTAISGGAAGVYDNDEGFSSYDPRLPVTCMASFTRASLLGNDPLLMANTANGGWMRMSIQPTQRVNPITGVPFNTNHAATGAIVYRDDVINGHHTMQVETSGHLAIGANHANRPY